MIKRDGEKDRLIGSKSYPPHLGIYNLLIGYILQNHRTVFHPKD